MPRSPIPERQPIGDSLTAAVIRLGEAQALAAAVSEGADVIYQGALIVRYGVRYLGKPRLSIVPGLIALDYGELLTGEKAWEFLMRRSNLYPRAEVFGYRNDGRDEMLTVKNLDLALPVEVLVYENDSAVTPIARPTALIADDNESANLPPRLLEYLARFPSIAAWQGGIKSDG
jgi:hypothetical protein